MYLYIRIRIHIFVPGKTVGRQTLKNALEGVNARTHTSIHTHTRTHTHARLVILLHQFFLELRTSKANCWLKLRILKDVFDGLDIHTHTQTHTHTHTHTCKHTHTHNHAHVHAHAHARTRTHTHTHTFCIV